LQREKPIVSVVLITVEILALTRKITHKGHVSSVQS